MRGPVGQARAQPLAQFGCARDDGGIERVAIEQIVEALELLAEREWRAPCVAARLPWHVVQRGHRRDPVARQAFQLRQRQREIRRA